MEVGKIGFNAGRVWKMLNEKGPLPVSDLCRELELTPEETALAVGWLARENKVRLWREDNKLRVEINRIEFSFG